MKKLFLYIKCVLAKAFQTIVKTLPDNKSDCPPVMHSRHSKDTQVLRSSWHDSGAARASDYGASAEVVQELLDRHLKKAKLSPDDKQDITASEHARLKIESDCPVSVRRLQQRFPNPSANANGGDILGWCDACNVATVIVRKEQGRDDIVGACDKHLDWLVPLDEPEDN
jgi:hypothetical protein